MSVFFVRHGICDTYTPVTFMPLFTSSSFIYDTISTRDSFAKVMQTTATVGPKSVNFSNLYAFETN